MILGSRDKRTREFAAGKRVKAFSGIQRAAQLKRHMARIAIHPGDHLAEELRALEMSAAELARQLKVPTNRVTGILNGQRAITGDTALRLGHFFGTSPQFWLNLQTLYDLRVAEQRAGRTIKALPQLKRASGKHERHAAHA